MKTFVTLILLVIAIQFVAQFDIYQHSHIITKGQKHGLYDSLTAEWILPLGKKQITEIYPNFYIQIDEKARSVKGILHNHQYYFETEVGGKALFAWDVENFEYMFENYRFTSNLFSFAKSPYNRIGISSIGAVITPTFLIKSTACNDNLNLCNLEISFIDAKLPKISFSNVNWRYFENKLYVISSTNDVENNIVDKISIYDLTQGEIAFEKFETLLPTETEEPSIDIAMEWMNTINIAPPALTKLDLEQEKINAKKFQVLLSSDFKSDSSHKYDIIIDLDDAILFANKNGAWFSSKTIAWQKVKDNQRYDFNDFTGGLLNRHLLTNKNELIIVNSSASFVQQKYDMSTASPMYDDYGNPLYEEYPGKHESGVWDLKNSKWLIEPIYSYITSNNNKYIASKSSYQLDSISGAVTSETKTNVVFNNDGILLDEFEEFNSKESIKLIFDADSVTYDAGIRYVFKGDSLMIVASGFYLNFSTNDILAHFSDMPIYQTYNSQLRSFLTRKDNEIFIHSQHNYNIVYKRKVDNLNEGYCFYNAESRNSEFISTNESTHPSIFFGVENYGDYSIIRNISEIEILAFNSYDNDGLEKYDDFGNPIVVNSITEGHYNTGLWDNKNKKWLLQPKYADILFTRNGFTAVERVDYVTYNDESVDYTSAVWDSTTTDYWVFNSNFVLTSHFTDNDLPWSNPKKYLHNLSTSDNVLDIIQQYKIIDTNLNVYSGNYTWVRTDSGLAIYDIDGLSRKITPLVTDAQWVHETLDLLYYIKNDSLNIRHKNATEGGALTLPITANLHIFDCDKFLRVDHGVDTSFYNLRDDYSLYRDEQLLDSNWEKSFADLTFTVGKIIALNLVIEQIEHIGDFDNFYTLDVKSNNDMFWIKDENQWKVKISTAHIKDFKIGYYIDSNYVKAVNWGESILLENHNKYTFYDLNLAPIKELATYKFVSSTVDQNLNVIEYTGEHGYNALALFDSKGNFLLKDVMDYRVENNELICTLLDPNHGEILYDDYGNTTVKRIMLK